MHSSYGDVAEPRYLRCVPAPGTTRRHYDWPRYWVTPGHNLGSGFFPEPTSILGESLGCVALSELLDEPCLVLLGEPGLGKSEAIRDAVTDLRRTAHAVHSVDLGAYDDGASLIGAIVDSVPFRDWRASEGGVLYLFLDGLDEALLHVKAIHKRLVAELAELGDTAHRLRLRLSCRSAEWLADMEDRLRAVFGEGAVQRLTLAPLRRRDAETAAKAAGVEADSFLSEIFERDLERLAAFPLTLGMMIDVAADKGALPATRGELFDHALVRLTDEPDSGRRQEGTGRLLHVGQRLAVAERIAACTVLAGRAAVNADAAIGDTADVGVRELAGFVEQDAHAAGAASFEITVEHIQEVLGTALFSDLGGGRRIFVHRSLAEYLAARYLIRHEMDVEQIMWLVESADDPDGRLVPQLREVAVWLAMLDTEVLREVMRREPEVLLRADRLDLDSNARSVMAAALLHEQTAIRISRLDRRVQRSLGTLRHPTLVDQLRSAIDPARPVTVRQTALTFARAAQLPELQRDLVSLARSEQEPAHLRHDALWALTEYADAATRQDLVPLASEWIGDDDDDEIKGQALTATFPSVLTVDQALAAITPARNPNLLGIYKVFVTRTLPEALRPQDLPSALAWAATVDYGGGQRHRDVLASLSDAILAAAWPHLDDPAVRAGFIEVLRPRIEHLYLLGSLHAHDDTRTLREPHGRRLIVDALLERSVLAATPRVLAATHPRLVLAEDYPWAVAKLRAAIGTPSEALWATLAATLFAPETCPIDELFELAGLSTSFAEQTSGWRGTVSLDDELARTWSDQANADVDPVSPADAPDMDEVIREDLETVEDRDPTMWWRLAHALQFDVNGRGDDLLSLEADITRLDGWTRSTEEIHDRIIAAAQRYLVGSPPDPEGWFRPGVVNHGAFAGYRALHLMAKLRPAAFEALDTATWERWMPAIVHAWHADNADDDRCDSQILTLAVERSPEELTRWALRMIDAESANGDGHLYVLSRLRHVGSSQLATALASKLADDRLRPKAIGELARFALSADPAGAVPYVATYLTPEAVERDRESASLVAAAALAHAPATMWPILKDVFAGDRAFGVHVFSDVAYNDRTDIASPLDDQSLFELLDWLYTALPPADDPEMSAAGYLTARHQAADVRERLLASLAQRGSESAVDLVDALAAKYPSLRMEHRKIEAREARLARWTAPAPGEIIQLAQTSDARLVLSSRHLHQVVITALRRIQRRARADHRLGELWSDAAPRRPKHEESLSTWLKNRLNEELRLGGRVVGRELEVRPNPSGRGVGERVDLSVFAPVGARVEGAQTASLIVEVKGCWHDEVLTAMETQLVGRYLTETDTVHGIYVVFWFGRGDWDPDDYRRGRCDSDQARLNDELQRQAKQLTANTHAEVTAFVLDGSV